MTGRRGGYESSAKLVTDLAPPPGSASTAGLAADLAQVTAERDLYRDRLDGQAWVDLEAERDRLAADLAAERGKVRNVRASYAAWQHDDHTSALLDACAALSGEGAADQPIRTFAFVDKWTGEPCPTNGDVLCTIPWSADSEHRHVDSRAYSGVADQPKPEAPSVLHGFCVCDEPGEYARDCGVPEHRERARTD